MLLWGDPSWKQALFGSRVWAPPKLVCKLARSGRGGRASGRAPFFGCLGGGSRRETPETPNLRPLVWLFGSLVVSYFGARREPASRNAAGCLAPGQTQDAPQPSVSDKAETKPRRHQVDVATNVQGVRHREEQRQKRSAPPSRAHEAGLLKTHSGRARHCVSPHWSMARAMRPASA